ncbi:hypothetical protein BDK51DRAFT_53066 [Blyttiomyces helicus]|uniref:Uncharacterized protein n=1 Tax=Blyttiomyces helicus TaxID=388810 RepID=A0A4P9W3K3_9FUNG|nr:hypothetical protein BDK51DRAFT_53066 [Blyttiomyces helicus]|eukprot:RKO85875.1 hypothetical protein BDK51DRAFT_53066 [Blyttiomyces helicus]
MCATGSTSESDTDNDEGGIIATLDSDDESIYSDVEEDLELHEYATEIGSKILHHEAIQSSLLTLFEQDSSHLLEMIGFDAFSMPVSFRPHVELYNCCRCCVDYFSSRVIPVLTNAGWTAQTQADLFNWRVMYAFWQAFTTLDESVKVVKPYLNQTGNNWSRLLLFLEFNNSATPTGYLDLPLLFTEQGYVPNSLEFDYPHLLLLAPL